MIHQLKQMGISPSVIHCNLSQDEWKALELERGEGRLSSNGTVIVNTGIYTGRSPSDRFIVKNKDSEDLIDWGGINLPLSENSFNILEAAVKKEMNGKDFSKFKENLSDALISTICPIGKRIKDLNNDKSYLLKILKEGSNRARKISEHNLNKIKEIVGFI